MLGSLRYIIELGSTCSYSGVFSNMCMLLKLSLFCLSINQNFFFFFMVNNDLTRSCSSEGVNMVKNLRVN